MRGPDRLVDRYSGPTGRMKAKIIVLMIFALLTECMLCCGCSTVIQPSRADLVRTNQFWSERPTYLHLDLKVRASSSVILYYNSVVNTQADRAIWDGTAKVYSGDTYFVQECQTVCDDTGSRKTWRDQWAESDNRSPAKELAKWLGKAEQAGRYHTTPIKPADYSDYLECCTDLAYRITWTETEMDWKALCDAHPDTLFGGDRLLTDFSQVEITLFFGTEDLLLDAILLEAEGEENWLSFTIIPSLAETGPNTETTDIIQSDILLSEEWSILSCEEAEDDI